MTCKIYDGRCTGEKVFKIPDGTNVTKISVRNVGILNAAEKIQFHVEQYKQEPGSRTKNMFFSIPEEIEEPFIKAVSGQCMNERIESMARLHMKRSLKRQGVKIPPEAKNDTEKLFLLYNKNCQKGALNG